MKNQTTNEHLVYNKLHYYRQYGHVVKPGDEGKTQPRTDRGEMWVPGEKIIIQKQDFEDINYFEDNDWDKIAADGRLNQLKNRFAALYAVRYIQKYGKDSFITKFLKTEHQQISHGINHVEDSLTPTNSLSGTALSSLTELQAVNEYMKLNGFAGALIDRAPVDDIEKLSLADQYDAHFANDTLEQIYSNNKALFKNMYTAKYGAEKYNQVYGKATPQPTQATPQNVKRTSWSLSDAQIQELSKKDYDTLFKEDRLLELKENAPEIFEQKEKNRVHDSWMAKSDYLKNSDWDKIELDDRLTELYQFPAMYISKYVAKYGETDYIKEYRRKAEKGLL